MWAAGGWLQERAGLRRIRRGSGQLFRQAVQHHFIQMPLGGEGEVSEVGTQVVPQRTLAAKLLPDGSKQRAAQLLNLIGQKGQHHQHGEHHRQVHFAVSEVVLELIALILERVEGFVLDLPASPAAAGQIPRVVAGDLQVGDVRRMSSAGFLWHRTRCTAGSSPASRGSLR